MPKLNIKLPNGIETSFFTQEDDIFIGRIPSINDVCVNHPSISRQHAHIKKREEGYTVYDLKSLNGVYLNDERVARGVLQEGDTLRLGEVLITIGFRDNSMDKTVHDQDIEDFEPTKANTVIPEKKSSPKTPKKK